MREMLPRTPEEIAEDEAFVRRYGVWEPFDPPRVLDFLAGFDRPWWIVGGWTIEAFTGVAREHEDIDVSIWSRDVAALRAHVGDDWHLWNAWLGTLRPLDDRHPGVADPESQLWMRRDAQSPWVMDLPLTRDRDGLWVNKRDHDDVRPLEDVTWVADDGIRYLNPEITLLFKAKLDRAKDRRDRDVTWPLLGDDQRGWLREAVSRIEASHPWLEVLTG